MGNLYIGLLVSLLLYWYLRRYRRKRAETARHLARRIWGNAGRQMRSMPDKTLLVPTDDLPCEDQWVLARSLRDQGLLEIRPLDRHASSRTPHLVVLTLTERGRQAFGFSERWSS